MSPEQRTKLCERDAPVASTAGLEVLPAKFRVQGSGFRDYGCFRGALGLIFS